MSELVVARSAVVDAWPEVASAGELPPAGAETARVFLVRHGVTAWNAEQRYQGRLDVPLGDPGRAQADALAGALGAVPFDAAYTSPLARARETAERVLGGRGLRAAAVPEFAELSYGLWQGRRRADALLEEPALLARWESDPWGVAFPGGESLADVRRRAGPAWDAVVRAHAGGCVLVCAHGHLNRVLLLRALGLPRAAFWAVPQPNAGCVVVDVDASGATATRLATPLADPRTPPVVPSAARDLPSEATGLGHRAPARPSSRTLDPSLRSG